MTHDSDLDRACRRLDELAALPATAPSRQEVLEALGSKWEGVQVHAGRALAAWGGRESIDRLREWLDRSLDKAAGRSVRGEAVRCLRRACDSSDAPWLLDYFFSAASPAERHEFFPFFDLTPLNVLRERIAVESQSSQQSRRDAARVATRRLREREAGRD